jgi:hypothetical protein
MNQALLTAFSVRSENELEVSSEDRSYMDDEKFGIPNCIQSQDKLDESCICILDVSCICILDVSGIVYQMCHVFVC